MFGKEEPTRMSAPASTRRASERALRLDGERRRRLGGAREHASHGAPCDRPTAARRVTAQRQLLPGVGARVLPSAHHEDDAHAV